MLYCVLYNAVPAILAVPFADEKGVEGIIAPLFYRNDRSVSL